jgi:hypothetical protein
MAPDYHQLEFDLRLYLTHLDQRTAAAVVPGEGLASVTAPA